MQSVSISKLLTRSTAVLALGLILSAPAHAQFGKLTEGLKKSGVLGEKVTKTIENVEAVGQVAKPLVGGIGLEEELSIGGAVSIEVIATYGGLWRDQEATKRVNLIGRTLALNSPRPHLDWRFGILNSSSVNAYAAPGGYVFITKGLYDRLTDDAQLAGVLAHEITHVTHRHALKIVERNGALSGAATILANQSSGAGQVQQNLEAFNLGIGEVTTTLFSKGFDPATEFEADAGGRDLAALCGYAPGGLRAVLSTLPEGGGVFDAHPPTQQRISRLPAE
jgi:beta-barrel assembly-enhancing protease